MRKKRIKIMNRGIYFVAGVYGVGKSTICQKLSEMSSIPFYSAGDLISEVNGEIYGANKVVKNKERNQDILLAAVEPKLQSVSSIILAGHFCIFDKDLNVELLPEYVFDQLHISKLILLEAAIEQIDNNIQKRDTKKYSIDAIKAIKNLEHIQACKVAEKLKVPFLIYEMQFNQLDVENLLLFLTRGG